MNKPLGLTATLACALMLSALPSNAEVVAPEDVVFTEYGEVETSLTGVAGNPENGAKLMDKGAGNCVACHKVSALSHLAFQGEVGPSLDGVADRWSEAALRGIVTDAKKTFDGSVMPSFYKTEGFTRLGDGYTGKAHKGDVAPLLTAQEIEDILSFLVTLKEN